MIKEFIPYEQAKQIKQLGFNQECFGHYQDVEVSSPFLVVRKINDIQGGYYTLAPLYQQAFRWFREKYSYFPSFDFQYGDSNDNRGYFFCIININDEEFFYESVSKNDDVFKTYEEAELECLKKLIEIVKS